MGEMTVGAGYARTLMELAVSKGADRICLLERAEIREENLTDQENRIPFEKFKALMWAGIELSKDPALALHFGEVASLAKLSIVGLITHASETMAEAFAQINRYGRLVIEVDGVGTANRFELVRDKQGLWLVDHRKNPNSFPELTESGFARMICQSAVFFPDRVFAKAVQVTHAQPGHSADYDRILQVPVTFNSKRNAILIDEDFMSLKLPTRSSYAFGILSDHAAALLESLESSRTVRGKVESIMIPILHTDDLNMDLIASKMGISRQTLYRKLKSEGISYEKLLDELRHTMALHYLNGKKVTVNETAYLVGFSDPSAFSRAFKRWTGRSPGKASGKR